ncbi:lactonase family protein [Microbacterium elymi]|uniref:lactonase family protein n=1 Tax=Microbacterium elymi TaxID=2909587 RepID=UPI00338D4357
MPGGLVATTDMGLDLVRFWRPAATGLRPAGAVVLPRGRGPRHMRWHPSGHLYVITELSREVFVLAPDASATWRVVGGTPLAPGLLDDDTAAELAASRDGEFLYAGIRGSNTIATLRVRGDGSELQSIALVDSGVDWPRHHVVLRDTLLAAGQRSNEIASLTLDAHSGVPGRVRYRTAVPSPTCLLPTR